MTDARRAVPRRICARGRSVRAGRHAHRLGAGDQRRPRLRPLFQVKWTETAYERGSLAGTSRWTAILSVVVRPPSSAEALRKNPLGLYVDAIDWSRELDVPPPRPRPLREPAREPRRRTCRSDRRSIPASPAPPAPQVMPAERSSQ